MTERMNGLRPPARPTELARAVRLRQGLLAEWRPRHTLVVLALFLVTAVGWRLAVALESVALAIKAL